MLCCCLPAKEPKGAIDSHSSDGFAYPGRRRQKGLASASYPMSASTGAGFSYYGQEPYHSDHQQVEKQIQPTLSKCQLISVTVPPGVLPGDAINIVSPESGRLIEARVPDGMFPGSSFMVKSPATPIATTAPVEPVLSHREAVTSPMHVPTISLPSSRPAARPFSMALDDDYHGAKPYQKPHAAPPPIQTSYRSPASSQMMMVQVPPSAPAGATVHVRIPGEDRVIATQVPANCTEFLVSYEPAVSRYKI